MSYEFRTEELFECDRCGVLLPGDLMVWLDNGEIYCEDCYDKLRAEEDANDCKACSCEGDDIAIVNPTGLSDLLHAWMGGEDFLSQLPTELNEEFTQEFHNGRNPFENEALRAKTQNLKLRNFNALDFETANEHPESICSMGIVFVRDGQIVDRYYSLVHPEPDYYSYFCQRVHRLGPADTDNAPNFKKAWNRIRNEVKRGNFPFVAHNASFDANCLRTALQMYRMEDPGYRFLDTLSASRRHFGSNLPNHQLQTVAAACGYDLRNHHNALADAEACAMIAMKTIFITDLLK